jgi:L-alanine-DL-glutamate epimerase-like enolase superfamily enzyme
VTCRSISSNWAGIIIPTHQTITLDEDGWVTIPQKPGLGLPIDWERLNKMTTAVLA